MILILLLCLTLAASQVSHQPITPKIASVKIGRSVRSVPSNTAFRIVFPAIGYDIGGKVY